MKEKQTKKMSLTQDEIREIELAKAVVGIRSNKDFILYSARCVYGVDSENRKTRAVLNQHRNMLTLYNKIISGIDVEDNMKEFMMEGSKLCQELM